MMSRIETYDSDSQKDAEIKMPPKLESVDCPSCGKAVVADLINQHLDRCVGISNDGNTSPPPPKKARVGSTSKNPHPFFQSRTQKSATPTNPSSFEPSASRTKPGRSSDNADVVILEDSSPDSDMTDSAVKAPRVETTSTDRKVEHKTVKKEDSFKPLAEVMRPATLDDYVGQEEAVGEETLLRRLLESPNIPSLILWGPPGCGKTSLAHIISKKTQVLGNRFVTLSAVAAGIKDVKDVVSKAQTDQKMFKMKTILFLDEIHRFNKAQQDVFLPHIEKGTITLIGATTENPSFSLNSALLSRCKVIVLEKLSEENIRTILSRAVNSLDLRIVPDDSSVTEKGLAITESAMAFLVGISDGDSRTALNSLQTAVEGFKGLEKYVITKDDIKNSLKKTHFLYDRKGDQHYDTISAFHKSMRFGKDTAALYYLARMLCAGEDPRFVARRLVVFASEDIGLADPSMLSLAVATQQACEKIGMPECRIMLSHCTVQFARAPKSRETYNAYGRAETFIRDFEGAHPPIPLAIRNAPTKLMKELGYAQGEYGSCLPESLGNLNFFTGPPPPHLK